MEFYLPLNYSTKSKCDINTTSQIFYNLQILSGYLYFGECSSRTWKNISLKYPFLSFFVSQTVQPFLLFAIKRNPIHASLVFHWLQTLIIQGEKYIFLDYVYLGSVFTLSWCTGSLQIWKGKSTMKEWLALLLDSYV